jgi:hypothetical protein
VPAFAPVLGVAVNFLLRAAEDNDGDLWKPFHRAAQGRVAISSAGYVGPNQDPDKRMIWIRDYYPTFVRKGGELRTVKFLSVDPKRQLFDGSASSCLTTADGRRKFDTPGVAVGDNGRWLAVDHVPLIHEDGNLVSTGDFAFLTDKIFSDNAEVRNERHLIEAGYRPRSPEEVTDELVQALAIERDRIIILPQMPGERTGHVDLYVLPLGPSRVMIPEIRQEAIDILGYAHERELGSQVKDFLDEQTRVLEKRGIRVERLPTMAPTDLSPYGRPGETWGAQFHTPANSLPLNHLDGERNIVLTRYDPPEVFPERYRELNARYQEKWRELFEGEGINVTMVTQTGLLRSGYIACLTHPIFA